MIDVIDDSAALDRMGLPDRRSVVQVSELPETANGAPIQRIASPVGLVLPHVPIDPTARCVGEAVHPEPEPTRLARQTYGD
jgi:hypothetical protein